MNASIIIVTRNRAADLKQTLEAMAVVRVPEGLNAEILVVDNDSTDETASVVRECRLSNFNVRYTFEGRRGKTIGLNRGMRETNGELILFTDDDVRPTEGWLHGVSRVLIDRGPCAVAGGVTLAPHLLRPWMTFTHRTWLASTEWIDARSPMNMVGANMGFSRAILDRVPEFDPELGPGALGFGDETMFAQQLLRAGFKIHAALEHTVEHHFDASRLLRASWLNAAAQRGRVHAYHGYHWNHWTSRFAPVHSRITGWKLARWRKRNPAPADSEGCPVGELRRLLNHEMFQGLIVERKRPRNYEKYGLKRIRPLANRSEAPQHAVDS